MLDDRDAPIRSHGSRALGWIAWVLGLAGTAALAWTALQVEDAREYQQAAREALSRAAPTSEHGATIPGVESAPSIDAAPFDRDASTSGRDVPTRRRPATISGAPLGALSIPRLRLSVVVLHGTDGLTLRRGVGHIETTAMPGQLGNVGIAGHRDTFFRPLRQVQLGDDVLLETPAGRLHYRVASFRVVGPSDVDVLDPTSDRTLTLVTCYPFSYFGSAPDRFVVRATRVDDAPEELAALPSHPFGLMDVRTSTEASRVPREPRGQGGPVGPGSNDESVVLQAIERFRIVYNGVLARRGETRPEGPLVFESCQVTMEGNEALAHCETLQTGLSSSDSAVWTFSLARAGSTWDVKSIAPN
jgi:sortase A